MDPDPEFKANHTAIPSLRAKRFERNMQVYTIYVLV